MIDKEIIRAEVDRLRKLVSDPILSGNFLMIGERNAYNVVLKFIDSLPEEPVSEDLLIAARRAAVDKPDTPLEFLDERPYSPRDEYKFIEGANWQRNHVWHDISEKPDMRKFVVFSDGKETMTPPLRNPFDDYPMLIDVANRKYGGGYKVWAYLEDLLPNNKED